MFFQPPLPAHRTSGPATLCACVIAAWLAGCQATPPADEAPVDPVEIAPVVIHHPPLPRTPAEPVVVTPPAGEDEADEGPGDLISRMVAGYGMQWDNNARIQQHIDWFANNPAFLERTFTRGHPFLHHIVNELEARELPTELALLPLIESAYDPFAYSHGRAAGLWQFIPGTGRRFGLRQNWWYDGRRDVVESTRAALDYLEYLHDFFDGDWKQALAAYNAGEGRVRRAIARNASQGRGTSYWDLPLPRETRGYVPRFLAAAAVLADPDAHGITLPELADVPGFDIVDIEGQMDLALAAELAGVDTDEIYWFNPGFNRWATDPEGPHRLLVPTGQGPAFRTALAELDHREQVQWARHRVASGETLIHIARRYNTTPEVIRAVNDINGHLIRAGDHLMVPQAIRSLDAYSGSADNRLAATQDRPRGDVRLEHEVVRGDSLWTISRRYGVGVRQLAAWNAMAPGDTLSVGRQLVIWQSAEAAGSTGQATIAAAPSEQSRMRRVNYTVRRGDSLWRIASRFSVSVDELLAWNDGLSRNAVLRPGQRLTLHIDVTRQSG